MILFPHMHRIVGKVIEHTHKKRTLNTKSRRWIYTDTRRHTYFIYAFRFLNCYNSLQFPAFTVYECFHLPKYIATPKFVFPDLFIALWVWVGRWLAWWLSVSSCHITILFSKFLFILIGWFRAMLIFDDINSD